MAMDKMICCLCFLKRVCSTPFIYRIRQMGSKNFETTDITKKLEWFYKGQIMNTNVFAYTLLGKLSSGKSFSKEI